MRNFVILISSLVILLASCSKEEQELDVLDYFPLHIGNEWDYIQNLEVRTDTTVTFDGKLYYRFISSRSNHRDTTYYRNEGNKIYRTRGDSYEYLMFDLAQKENETWEMSLNPNSKIIYDATIRSKNAVVETDNFIFEDCFEFFYDDPKWADDEFTIFLAKGIGIVHERGGYKPEPGLKRVVINRVETIF